MSKVTKVIELDARKWLRGTADGCLLNAKAKWVVK